MRLRKLIKYNALRALRHHWGQAAAISLVLMVLSQVFVAIEMLLATVFDLPDFIDPMRTPQAFLDDLPNAAPVMVALVGTTVLLQLLLLVPLQLGVKRWLYLLGDGRVEETFSIFEYFSSTTLFFRAIWLKLLVFFLGLFWSVVYLLMPGAIIVFAKMAAPRAGTDLQALLCRGLEGAGYFLLFLMLLFLAVRLMRYYLVPFAFAEEPDDGVIAAIRRSVQSTRGFCGALFAFELSLFGWRLLDLLIIPRIFSYPYRTTAKGLYAHYLFERARRQEAERQSGATPKEAPGDPQPEPAS